MTRDGGMPTVRAGLAAVCAALVLVLGCTAAAQAATESTAAAHLRSIVEDVGGADGSVFDLHDDAGQPMDTLEVAESAPGHYVGVSDATYKTSFSLRVATSTDLVHWHYESTLDSDASAPTLAPLGDGRWIVAYEKASTLRVLPLINTWPAALAPMLSYFNRVNIRVRVYNSLDDLLAGKAASTFTAPHSLSRFAEGTPSVVAATPTKVTFAIHYYADLDRNGFPDLDREATATLSVGVLGGLRRWKATDATALNAAIGSLAEPHPGFSGPPQGSFGDTDTALVDGATLQLIEVEYAHPDFSSWRLLLRDGNSLRPLSPVTPGHSRSFANPSLTRITGPDGRPAIVVSTFLFGEGAAPGEAGQLLYWHEL